MRRISSNQMMSACVIDDFGCPTDFRLAKLTRPVPAQDEVLVEVEYASVNHVDTLIRSGKFQTEMTFPHIPGRDFCGKVALVGENVKSLNVGDSVWGASAGFAGRDGASAEFVRSPADRVYKRSSAVDVRELAALSHPALTACLALDAPGNLEPGSRLLVIGGAGNVGRCVVQLAAMRGIVVTSVARDSDREQLLADGAAETLVRSTNPSVYAASAPFDAIIDAAGVEGVSSLLTSLSVNGSLVLLANPDTSLVLQSGDLYMHNRRLVGFAISRSSVAELRSCAERTVSALEDGWLRSNPIDSIRLDGVSRAHLELEAGMYRRRRFVVHLNS